MIVLVIIFQGLMSENLKNFILTYLFILIYMVLSDRNNYIGDYIMVSLLHEYLTDPVVQFKLRQPPK